MPNIKDWSYNYGTVATATTITCDPPACSSGDLLLAILSTDTGQQTYTSPGWTSSFSYTNTVNLGIMYKYASASESTWTFTYSAQETANIAVISIEDVHPTIPFNGQQFTGSRTSLARNVMPRIVTTSASCLIIYAGAHSSVAVPTIIEGPVSYLFGKDGNAHSDCISWTIQSLPGSSSADVYISSLAAAAQQLAVIAINPPSVGAINIPGYCAKDLSDFIDPISSTTPYNGNTAFAATATSYFSSLLNGKTLSNGTTAAQADYGINTYHGVGRITGVATKGTWAGATTIQAVSNRVIATGKNIISHVMPLTPITMQTTDNVTLTGTMGLTFGMVSQANIDYKMWHVHGSGTPWKESRTPVIINSLNTTGIISSSGSLNTSSGSLLGFGWAISGFTVAPVWTFASLWVLDTTTVAGGTPEHPLKIDGIVNATSTGKERMSVVQQGKGQMLILQPIQIGDGGTNKVYLDLNASAVEFPKIYDKKNKLTNYCSVPNVAGITLYSGNTDVFKITNAVVSSADEYFFNIHPSSSLSASYDFSGLTIVGGRVTLYPVTAYDSITFSDCNEIYAYNCYLTNCSITTPKPYASSSLLINPSTTLENVSFSTTNTASYAIRIINTGSYYFSNVTFNGYNKSIKIDAISGSVTLNLINSNTPTTSSLGATVIINNTVNITLTGLKDNTEVRVYQFGTINELTGIENAVDGSLNNRSFSFSLQSSTNVTIVVSNILYEYISFNYIIPESNSSIPIQQRIDRNYKN